tara:strand:+ start:1604 stop:4102 length:2499 start_codon:yes stop_codon:yes gene_type:complete
MSKKIRIKKLPEGFEVKDGKVIEKMSHGGYVTGDQAGYGLATGYTHDSVNDANDVDVRFSLSSVPREMANLEAEGGETVLTDLNNNGTFGLYDIKGPRHSQGGVPMFLPEQSFIFSDTNKMKLSSKELAQFGIESRKKMTPADVSKRYQLNEFLGARAEDDADHITEKSAELMLEKNMMKLSKLAFGQESKKLFEDGVPLAAYPYLQSIGQNPFEFAASMDQRNQSMQQAKKGGEKAQEGRETKSYFILGRKVDRAEYIDYMIRNDMHRDFDGNLEDGFLQTLSADEIKMYGKALVPTIENYDVFTARSRANAGDLSITDEAFRENFGNFGSNQGTDDVVEVVTSNNTEVAEKISKEKDKLPDDRIPVLSDIATKMDGILRNQGIDVQDIMDVGDAGIANMQRRNTESGFYGDVTQDNISQWYDNNKMVLQAMGYESYDDLVKKEGEDWQKNKKFVKSFQENKNKALATTWDNDPKVREYFEKEGITKDQFVNQYGFDASKSKGTNAVDGLFGEYTLNRRDFTGIPEPEVTEDPEPEPEVEAEPEKKLEGYTPREPEFYLQDKVKMSALAARDRDLFLPFEQPVERVELDPQLMDPTRAIAAINEQKNISDSALAQFAGPQSFSARSSKNAGTALKAVADTTARYDAANVGILNKADAFQAQVDMNTNAAERDRSKRLYDNTVLASQRYMDEQNLDREQMADMFADAVTNKMNTYNLNTLFPYFDIMPGTDGNIEITDTKAFDPVQPEDPYKKITELAKIKTMMENAGVKDPDGKILASIYNPQVSPSMNNLQASVQGVGINNLGYQNQPAGKKGKEVKRYAVPFYTGKMGT